jgi:diguanylate cyclase (GGDEF)-like protein
MVFIDLQTDLYNRRYFNDCYEKQISLAKRNDDPLSLIIFELKVNELFDEHPTSSITERHLRVFAELVSDQLSRPTDTLFRYSENEFTVLLPDTYIFGAKHIIQKVLSSVAGFKSTVEDVSFEKINIAAGMASLEALQKNTNIIELVEKNLSQNKQSGNALVSRYYNN